MGTRVSIHGRSLQFDPLSGQLYFNDRPILGAEYPSRGKLVFVDSNVAAASGRSPDEAVATIDEAVAFCSPNLGDKIIVLPGHSETITAADAIDLDVAGISVIGLGVGDAQAQVVFDHANATIAIDADNVRLAGLRLSSSVTSVGVGVNVKAGATDSQILGNRLDVVATGTDEFLLAVDLKAGCHRTRIEGNTFDMGLGGAVAAVKLTGASDGVVVRGNYARGDYSTAVVAGDTTLSTNVLIEDNLLVQGIGGNIGTEPGIELLTGSTGVIRRNDIVCNLATKAASIVADTCFLFENYYNEDVSGAATGGIIGAASADD